MLEVGDRLYYEQSFTRGWKRIITIERTTATQAISGYIRLDKAFRDGSRAKGSTGYGAAIYYLLTPEVEAEIRHQRLAAFVKDVFSKERLPLTADKVERIYAIVNEAGAGE